MNREAVTCYIYIGKIPEDGIFDVDVAFQIYESRDMKHPVAVNLIKAIDGAKYVSDDALKLLLVLLQFRSCHQAVKRHY